VEPALAVDPSTPGHWIGVWQQDRWIDSDGGATTIAVATSSGGIGWSRPVPLGADKSRPSSNDKVWVTADPVKPRTAYVVWDRYETVGAAGSVRFSKTSDGGRTWSRPRAILKQPTQASDFNQILVDPRKGVLYEVYEDEPQTDRAPPSVIDIRMSRDGGRSWSPPTRVASLQLPGLPIPGTRLHVRGGDGMQAAIDPRRGTIYLVWERKTSGVPEIAFASSRDGGSHWSIRRHIGPTSPAAAFLPNIAINDSGDVAVSYYAFRPNHPGLTDYRIIVSRNAGRTFGTGRRLDSFNILQAPKSGGGYFVGDYEGLASEGRNFIAFWSGSVPGRTSVRSVQVTPLLSPGNWYLAAAKFSPGDRHSARDLTYSIPMCWRVKGGVLDTRGYRHTVGQPLRAYRT